MKRRRKSGRERDVLGLERVAATDQQRTINAYQMRRIKGDGCTFQHELDRLIPIPQSDRYRQLVSEIVDPSEIFSLRVESRGGLRSVQQRAEVADRTTRAGKVMARGRLGDRRVPRDGRDTGWTRDGALGPTSKRRYQPSYHERAREKGKE